MKDNKLLYQIKELEKYIVLFLTKDRYDCQNIKTPTPTQIMIVNYIISHDKNNVYQRDLEKELNLTRATLSGVLKTMERNKIITRVIDINDARSKKIILNSKYEEIFKNSQKKLTETEKILTKNIDSKELVVFNNVLNKMKENIKVQINNTEGDDKDDKTNEKLQ